MGNSPSLQVVQKKNRPEKFPFIATNSWIVLAVRWSGKHFFAPNSLISQKSHGEEDGKTWHMQSILLFKKMQKAVLKTFWIFTPVLEFLFIKIAGLQECCKTSFYMHTWDLIFLWIKSLKNAMNFLQSMF